MNDSVSRKKIRLGEVASALNVDPKLIRNWIHGGRFDLLGDENRAPNKWREFSFFDVAHLAIASPAIKYGFSVGEAHDFAGATLKLVLGNLLDPNKQTAMPAGVLVAVMNSRRMYLARLSSGEPRCFITPMDDEEMLLRQPATVRINLETCVGSAFVGLTEMGHDAWESSRPKEYSEEEAAQFSETIGTPLNVSTVEEI